MSTEKKLIIKKVLLIVSISILLMLIIGLLYDKLNFLDQTIYNFIIRFKSSFLTSFFKFITFFASIEWFVILGIIILIFNKDRKLNLVMILYLIFIALITFFMKSLFIRERPYDLMIIEEIGYSFPSGHSSVSLAFYGFVSYLVYKSKLVKGKKILLISLLLAFSFLIGISRIYLGVHYPSDVMAGFMVGIIYLMIFILVYDIEKRRRR